MLLRPEAIQASPVSVTEPTCGVGGDPSGPPNPVPKGFVPVQTKKTGSTGLPARSRLIAWTSVPGPESRGGRGGGDQRPVGQVHGSVRLTDVIDRVDRIRRTDGEPIDHHAIVRGSSRLGIHKTVVVSDVRGGRVTDAVGDEDETELVARVEPRRGLENDAGLGPASHPDANQSTAATIATSWRSPPAETLLDMERWVPFLTFLPPFFASSQRSYSATILQMIVGFNGLCEW